jgi:translation elongation factor EF-G
MTASRNSTVPFSAPAQAAKIGANPTPSPKQVQIWRYHIDVLGNPDMSTLTFLVVITISPQNIDDIEKFNVALSELANEDPSFHVHLDSGMFALRGMSLQHLDDKVLALKNSYKLACRLGDVSVAYRKRLSHKIEIDRAHKKLSGVTPEFAHIKDYVRAERRRRGERIHQLDHRRRVSKGIRLWRSRRHQIGHRG